MKNWQKVRESHALFDRIRDLCMEGPDAIGWLDTIIAIEKEAKKGLELTKKPVDPYLKKERGE